MSVAGSKEHYRSGCELRHVFMLPRVIRYGELESGVHVRLSRNSLVDRESESEGEGEFKYELESKQPTTFRPCLRQPSVDLNSIVVHLIQTPKKEPKTNHKNVYHRFKEKFEQISKKV